MRTVYIDPNEFKCHPADDGTRIAYETSFFDEKCDAFIEGFRIVPDGYSWTRSDGYVFKGPMISAWKDYAELDNAQREYERQLLKELQGNSIPIADLEAAYQEGVNSAYD